MTLQSFGSKALFMLLFLEMLTSVAVGLCQENAQENNLATMLLTLKGKEVSYKIQSTDKSVAYGRVTDLCKDYLLISMIPPSVVSQRSVDKVVRALQRLSLQLLSR